MNDIIKLAVDGYKGHVEKYSVADSQETLRNALVELNGGSTKLNYKNIRDGKCAGLFAVIEEILAVVVNDELSENDFFNAIVDYRNVAEGDENEFVVEDDNLFVVDKAANGTQAVRRQRLAGNTTVTIPTEVRMVRIYEELNRVLAGRVDFNHFIDVVARSFKQQLLQDIYTLWSGATAVELGGTAYFPVAGAFDEDKLIETIAHVEAAAGGKKATIIGTKKALRNLKESIMSDGAKEEIHEMGYVGKYFGNPVVEIPQRHKAGTTEFVFDDKILTIVAGEDKPIKVKSPRSFEIAA